MFFTQWELSTKPLFASDNLVVAAGIEDDQNTFSKEFLKLIIHDASAVPVPKDRIVMVIDLTDETPLWEFAHWAENCCLTDDGLSSGWCVADHETLRWAAMSGDVAEAAQSIFDEPTHWQEVPAIPVAKDVAA